MSLLFVGVDLNPDISLFLELTELGELVAYYCTLSDYKNAQCSNKVELFVNNIIAAPLIIK